MKSNRDLFAAAASGIVGALALASSVYNVYLQKEQTRAQVLPRVHWAVGSFGDDWSFVVQNDGVGPAEVRRIRVSVDGVARPSWAAAEEALVPGVTPRKSEATTAVTSLSAGKQIEVFSLSDRVAGRTMFLERKRLGVEVCYCSVLGDCWTAAGSGLRSDPPEPVPRCDPDPVPFQDRDERKLDELARAPLSDAFE